MLQGAAEGGYTNILFVVSYLSGDVRIPHIRTKKNSREMLVKCMRQVTKTICTSCLGYVMLCILV